MFAIEMLSYGVEWVVKGLAFALLCFAVLCCGGWGWPRSF